MRHEAAADYADRVRRELARAGLDPDRPVEGGTATGRRRRGRGPGRRTARRVGEADPSHRHRRTAGRRRRAPRRPAGRRRTTELRRRLADGVRRGRATTTRSGPRPDGTGGRWPSAGRQPARCRPDRRWWPGPPTPTEVAAVLALCRAAGVPVTPSAGRSGVCGGSVPVFGGVSLDLCGLAGLGRRRRRLAGGRHPGRHLRPRRGVRAPGTRA